MFENSSQTIITSIFTALYVFRHSVIHEEMKRPTDIKITLFLFSVNSFPSTHCIHKVVVVVSVVSVVLVVALSL
jgi:hypothetical protein